MKITMMTFSDYDKESYENKVLYSKVRSAAISYIGLGSKPSLKVSGWLSSKGYPDFITDQVIKELTDEGYINDIKHAKKIIRSRTGKRAESPLAMIKRIYNSGVPMEIAQSCVYDHFNDPDIVIRDIDELLHLKFKSEMVTTHEWNSERKQRFKQKCFRFLMSRGYKSEESFAAINKLVKDGIEIEY